MLATTTTTATTTAALTLSHNQEVRVKGFSHLAQRITVGTCRGFCHDGEKGHQRALENGHDTAWTSQDASVLTNDYPGKAEALAAAAAATAAAPEIEDGMVVEIEGELFTVKVLGERYCDPVKFVRLPVAPPAPKTYADTPQAAAELKEYFFKNAKPETVNSVQSVRTLLDKLTGTRYEQWSTLYSRPEDSTTEERYTRVFAGERKSCTAAEVYAALCQI